MRIAIVLGLAGLCLLSPCGVANSVADEARRDPGGLNEAAVTIMSGTTFDGNATIVRNLAATLNDSPSLRIVPMIGQGPAQTLRDILSLPGVDLGITHSTVLYHFASTGELGPIQNRVVYVAKLFNEDLHLLARSNTPTVEALNGKIVNVGPEGSGTQIAARILFEALGLQVQEAHLDTAHAVEALKSGDVDATILIGTTPVAGLAQLGPDSGLKLLPVPYPEGLEDDTYPSALTHDDYPALIESGGRIDTIAICAVLVALHDTQNAEHHAKLDRFIGRLFSNFDALQREPNHPKWREVNFAATLEDWQRAPQAQVWIESAKSKALAETRERKSFEAFLTQTGNVVSPEEVSEANQQKLFRAFKAWSKAKQSN